LKIRGVLKAIDIDTKEYLQFYGLSPLTITEDMGFKLLKTMKSLSIRSDLIKDLITVKAVRSSIDIIYLEDQR